MSKTKPRVLIIEARFYDHIADMLLDGATAALDAAGVAWEKFTVPGIYEIPAAIAMVLSSGKHYDGYVTLGTAIRGESDHYHYICTESMQRQSELAVAENLALGNGVLTVHDEEQALKRADPTRKNIGGLAARACLRMMELKRELKLT
ncbi:MAG TPA: 6,7-dimethyl-8-ribityllumazine synthase [Candidatus Omnitrophota bacterium]|nr:6,7-dimethyl-8-ribityllumazine synthase [Candidatus Omnitrophota bacterium]